MKLDEYESYQQIVKNSSSILTAIAGIIGAFFNQKMINPVIKDIRDNTHVQDVWRRRKLWLKMHTKSWYIFFTSMALVVLLSWIENWLDGKIETEKGKEQAKTDKENREYQDKRDSKMRSEYFAAITNMQKKNDEHTKDITGNMAMMYGEGRRKDSLQHEKTRKNIKIAPANISFLPEPHNVIRVNYKNDSLYLKVVINNDGGLVAYGLIETAYWILHFKNGLSGYLPVAVDATAPSDLPSGIGRISEDKFFLPNQDYEKVKNIVCIVSGRYYLSEDLNEKSKKNFTIGRCYMLDRGESVNYCLTQSMSSLINEASKNKPNK